MLRAIIEPAAGVVVKMRGKARQQITRGFGAMRESSHRPWWPAWNMRGKAQIEIFETDDHCSVRRSHS
jgi:hypothetical protein